jgi:hypothetical protein
MTMQRTLTLFLLLGLVLMAGVAQAVTLFTPPLFPDGDSQIDCYLVNVSNEVRHVTIEVLNRDGELVREPVVVVLYPGTEEVASAPASDKPRYCKFVVDGTRSNVRASILVRKPGIGSISALSAQ